jgi:D-alanyl-D-alanine carboxypeptidase/D-alanyl-D-alanine-endopeptidase (penicillin-binding protein 4)
MKNILLLFPVIISTVLSGQERPFEILLGDSSMIHATISMCIINAETGSTVFEYEQNKCLTPASVMKIITSSAALEILGPDYTFTTAVKYSGTISKREGMLNGNLIMVGGGDPALGSPYFEDHYGDFIEKWVDDIRALGIRKIDGKVISDDSYYDYLPLPSKWLWEDTGNYYGAGVYGLSVFDNTYEIHFTTAREGSSPVVTKITPEACRYDLTNYLTASGATDKGYIFSAPYSASGWIAGTIPVNNPDFILKGSIPDPPLLLARMLDSRLESEGIDVSGNPSTLRLEKAEPDKGSVTISLTESPPLKRIIEFLNHESINLYAETLLKELDKKSGGKGSTAGGLDVISEYLETTGINKSDLFLTDGSGLSPVNAVNSRSIVNLLYYMRNKGRYFDDFISSLPAGGKEGTLSTYFLDPVFENRLRAKSGSMTRVRAYAGFIKTKSDKELIFSIIINDFSGSSAGIISGIESILKDTILNN